MINDTDAEGNQQMVTPQVTSIPGKGTLTLFADGSYEFVPVNGFVGPVDFPYEVTDNDPFNPAFAMATLHILVQPPPTKVSGFMWEDLNGNGIQDTGEPGIEGLLIVLYDLSDNVIAATETDANGLYTFNGVEGDQYYYISVQNVDPDFTLTTPNAGSNDEIDSDLDELFGTFSSGLLFVENDECEEVDGGFYVCSIIGDLVWFDTNENDVADPTENGINGLIVNLYRLINGSYQLVQTTVTAHKPGTPSDDGWYNFCAPAGTYYIEVVMPPLGLVQTVPNVGNNEEIDSDLTNAFGVGTTSSFVHFDGVDKLDLGAGFYPMATVGNRVWHDSNDNGFQDDGEDNVANVLVEVFEAGTGNKVAESTTNYSGIYSIEYLQKKDYYLKFSPPNGYGFTIPNTGGESVDSDVDHSFGYKTTAAYSMQPGQNYINVDAGLKFGVLPVEWLSINAEYRGDFNLVSWRTATEINSDLFIIERKSEAGSEFEVIGEVDAAGESVEIRSYAFKDYDVRPGMYYYRIKQLDKDGKFEYSDIVSVEVGRKENLITLAPNPARDKSILNLSLNSGSEVLIKVVDNNGRLIRSYTIEESNGDRQESTIEIEDLPVGVYMVHIHQSDFNMVKRLIIIR